MLKKIILVICLIAICSSLFALDMSKAEPIDEKKIPKFALNIRRTEIIFFGSIPVAYPIVSLASKAMKKDLDFWQTVGIASGVAASIAITDLIIGLIKK